MSQEREEKVEERERAASKPSMAFRIILGKEDDKYEIRATATETLILNKSQRTPKMPNIALPVPASSISARYPLPGHPLTLGITH